MYVFEVFGMKTKFMIIIIFIILVASCFSGCLDGDKKSANRNSELDKFVGTWYGYNGAEWGAKFIFNEDRTLYKYDMFGKETGIYYLANNELRTETKSLEDDDSDLGHMMYYKFEFAENDSKLILRFPDDHIWGMLWRAPLKFNETQEKIFGKWSTNYSYNHNDKIWIEYHNFTFYENMTVKEERNFYNYSTDEIEWYTSWYYFYFNEGQLCYSPCFDFKFIDDDTLELGWYELKRVGIIF